MLSAAPTASSRPRYEVSVVQTPSGGYQGMTPRSGSSLPRAPRRRSSRTPSSAQTPSSSSTAATPGALEQNANSAIYFVSIVEFHNHQQVGMAAMNIKSNEVQLWQYPETSAYSHTLALLLDYDPQEILMPHTADNTTMYKLVTQECELSKTMLVRRKFFNENQGLQLLRKYGMDSSGISANMLATDSSRYLCLAACGCLLKYIETIQSLTFVSKSLRIEFGSLEGRMMLTSQTVHDLELVANLSHGQRRGSLFQTLNACKTSSGARLLRRNILQPLTDLTTLEIRQNAVEEMLSDESTFFQLLEMLSQLADLEHMTAFLAQIPSYESVVAAQNTIVNVLCLKRSLVLLPKLHALMANYANPLLRTIAENIGDDSHIKALVTVIDKHMDPQRSQPQAAGAGSAGGTNAARAAAELVFAVHRGMHGLLDVARATYVTVMDTITEHVEELQQQLSMPQLTLEFNKTRGFHLTFPKALQLPDQHPFVQLISQKSKTLCSTEELLSLEDRRRDSFDEIVRMTAQVLQELLVVVRRHISWLGVAAESVAMLDMLLCFANRVTTCPNYVRPHFRDYGAIAIKHGRHPVAESQGEFVPNDMFLAPDRRIVIITGPNSSGKSTCLRQCAVLAIMAQIGCHVPAEQALLCPMTQILTRFSTDDSFESNSGTFLKEMTETAYILDRCDATTLVLIDELGRGTSNAEGVGIAWAVVEELVRRRSLTLFATHFRELTELPLMYPAIKNVQLQVDVPDGDTGALHFAYRVAEGCKGGVPNYGIRMAALAQFPPEIIQESKRIADNLKERMTPSTGDVSNKLYHEIVSRILHIHHSSMPVEQLRDYLVSLRQEYDIH